jgi:hypothetical protein
VVFLVRHSKNQTRAPLLEVQVRYFMESFTDNANSMQQDGFAEPDALTIDDSNPIAGMRYGESVIVARPQEDDRLSNAIRISVAVLLVCSVTYVILDSFGDRNVEATILRFLEWVSENPYEGVLAVICVYIVATVLFVPGSVLTLGTGYAFGSACDSTAHGVFLASTVSRSSA